MSYRLGQTVTMEAKFVDPAGAPFDPAAVTLRVLRPDGTVSTVVPSTSAVGTWTGTVDTDQPGAWAYRFEGDDVNTTPQEGTFVVLASPFEPTSPAASTDYFTRAEFRSWAHDVDASRFSDEDIDLAQVECIEALEAWARTSWANVEALGDGDGNTPAFRVRTEVHRATSTIVLRRRPIVAVRIFRLLWPLSAPTDLDPNTFVPDFNAGVVRIDPAPIWPWPPLSRIEVTYTFGWGSAPRAVKVPMFKAVRSRIDESSGPQGAKGTKVPARTRSYSTRGTTFDLSTATAEDLLPWPWALDASAEIRAYWGPSRPRVVMSAV